jgi:hypothetical protein
MKIFARERSVRAIPRKEKTQLLRDEAAAVLRLMHKGVLREIYFNENHEAIIVLESRTRREARLILKALPLVKSGFIDFEVMELRPYTGFARLGNT